MKKRPEIGSVQSDLDQTLTNFFKLHTIFTIISKQLSHQYSCLTQNMSKRKNGLKQVQFSPIWTKLCQILANLISKICSKPEGPQQSNKGVNEEIIFQNNSKIFLNFPLKMRQLFRYPRNDFFHPSNLATNVILRTVLQSNFAVRSGN